VLPELKRLAVLFDPGFPPDRVQLANLEQVASSTGLTLVMRAVGDANAAVAALRGLGRTDADAVFVLKEALLRRAAAPSRPTSRSSTRSSNCWSISNPREASASPCPRGRSSRPFG
jgi:hypothetical protein